MRVIKVRLHLGWYLLPQRTAVLKATAESQTQQQKPAILILASFSRWDLEKPPHSMDLISLINSADRVTKSVIFSVKQWCWDQIQNSLFLVATERWWKSRNYAFLEHQATSRWPTHLPSWGGKLLMWKIKQRGFGGQKFTYLLVLL